MKASCMLFIFALLVIAGCSKDEPTKPVKEEPTITLTSPADGDTVVDTVLITATASDNKGVVKVEFYIDATLRHTDLLEPYEYTWNCMEEADSSQHTIYAKAYDGDGYSATSAVVTVTVDYSYGPPLPVTLSYVTPSPTDSTVLQLGWTRSGAADFNSYRVYRSLTAGVTEASDLVTEILQRTTTTYEDSGLITGQTYYYRVFVYDNDALSAGSNELSGTPKKIGVGYALKFDGINDFTLVPFSAVLNPTNQLTLEAWVKRNAMDNHHFIISRGHADSYELQILWPVEQNKVRFILDNPGTVLDSKTSIDTEGWYHIAATYDGAKMKIYVNGVLEDSTLFLGPVNSTTSPVYIGSREPGSPFGRLFFEGIIDELRIWNVTRPQGQIQATMHSRLTGSETGLVGYWTFDEGKNQIAVDHSGNGNDGQLGSTSGVDSSDPAWVVSDAPIY